MFVLSAAKEVNYESIEEEEKESGKSYPSPDSMMEKYGTQIKVGSGLAAGSVVLWDKSSILRRGV